MRPDRQKRKGLRILMFCPSFYPRVGGAERQTELLASALIDLGVACEVLTPRADAAWPAEEMRPGGVPVRRFPVGDLRRALPRVPWVGPVNTAMIGWRTMRAVRAAAGDFDVVYVPNGSTPMSAFAVVTAARLGRPTIVKPASPGPWFDLVVLREQPLWGPLTARWLLRYATRWQATSAAVAEALSGAGVPHGNVVVVPNGVALSSPPAALPSRARRFLYLGRLARTAPRDFEGLIRAFEAVARVVPEAELALVGGGDRLEEIRALAGASPARQQISVPGQQDPQAWLAWAHCLVQPSFVEGMSNALLEGMAAGLACVAYDIPPNREVLEDGSAGLLVRPGDGSDVIRALLRLACEPGLAAAWGRRARSRAESVYDVRRIAPQVAALCGSLTTTPMAAESGPARSRSAGSLASG